MRFYRLLLVLAVAAMLLSTCVVSYLGQWWPKLLDWAVVAIPALAGLVAWVIPVKQATRFHRVWLFVGGVVLSGLIWLQQWETGVSHAREMAKLATKEDIAKLPSAADIVKEFQKSQTKELSRSPGVPPVLPKLRPPIHDNRETNAVKDNSDSVNKGIQELKSLIVGQRWGLSAEQLVVLSRMMAPYASVFNSWQGGGDLITAILGNQDSTRFALNLVASLRSAGWNLPGSGFSQAIFTGNPVGLIVQIHSRDDANMPALNQLLAIVQEDKIQFHGEIADTVLAGQFRIIIGARPE
jgi:hypothetical protein